MRARVVICGRSRSTTARPVRGPANYPSLPSTARARPAHVVFDYATATPKAWRRWRGSPPASREGARGTVVAAPTTFPRRRSSLFKGTNDGKLVPRGGGSPDGRARRAGHPRIRTDRGSLQWQRSPHLPRSRSVRAGASAGAHHLRHAHYEAARPGGTPGVVSARSSTRIQSPRGSCANSSRRATRTLTAGW